MLVFKFGGASVKDADNIVNLANVVKKYDGNQLLIVVSCRQNIKTVCHRLTYRC